MKVLHCFFLHALLYLPIVYFAIIGKYKNIELFFSNQNMIKYLNRNVCWYDETERI